MFTKMEELIQDKVEENASLKSTLTKLQNHREPSRKMGLLWCLRRVLRLMYGWSFIEGSIDEDDDDDEYTDFYENECSRCSLIISFLRMKIDYFYNFPFPLYIFLSVDSNKNMYKTFL